MKLARRILAFYAVLTFLLFTAAVKSRAAEDDGVIRVRALFMGDIMTHEQQLEAARYGASWDFRPQFRRVKPLFRDSLAVGNLETVFAGEGRKFAGYPAFNTPDELASALADLGVDVVMLANNHILDQGLDAASRTAETLDGAGILWTGLVSQEDPDEPLALEYGGLKWAFVNYSYGSNISRPPAKSEDLTLNVISEGAIVSGLARAKSYGPDVTIAFFHWGLEYHHNPSKQQRDIAALCLKNGADAVIGAHPHVLQPVEVTSVDKRYAPIAYSLGNFVSYQRTKPRERGVLLAMDVEKKPGGRAEISRLSVAPMWVSARKEHGRRKIEAVYAGGGGMFNHAGLPAGEIAAARAAGNAVLDFLGAAAEPDAKGFYTLWEAASPDIIPKARRQKPE